MDDICPIGASGMAAAAPRAGLLLMDCPSAMLVVDERTGAILDANRAAASFYGAPLAELQRLTLADLRSPLDAAMPFSPAPGGGDGSWIECHTLADGRSRSVSLAAASAVFYDRPLQLVFVREADDFASRLGRLDQAIDAALRRAPSWPALAAAVAPVLAEACDAERAWLAVVGPDGRMLAGEPPDRTAGQDADPGGAGAPAFDDDPVVRACRAGSPLRLAPAGPDEPATLVVPLDAPDAVAAALCLQAPGEGRLDEAHQAWLTPVIRRLAMAVQLVRATQRTRLQDTALASTADGVFITDRDGRIEWVNGGLAAITGYRAGEMLGCTPAVFRSGQQDPHFYHRMWSTILAGLPWAGEVINRRKDGRLITVRQTITPVTGEGGAVTHFVAVHEDVTAQRAAEARSAYLIAHDQLTGLPNRALLRDRLHQAMLMADRCSRRVALIHLDLDRFSDLNAAYGHEAGDRLLAAAARCLNEALRRSDTVARLGADEFAVLLPELRRDEDARQVAVKLAHEIEALAGSGGLPASLSCCIGTAIYPGDGGDVDQLVMAASLALGAAKRAGRGRIAAYCRSMSDQLTARVDMQRDLALALHKQEFSLAYQPQVALIDGRVIGVEALLRWKSPDRGMVSPAAFIPVAEDSGLIVEIGRWVIDEACRQIADWRARELAPVRVAVNISPVQLSHGGLAESVARSLERWKVAPAQLEFELTESVLLTRSPGIVAELKALHDMGVTWAVDDFGTGYASLDYVRRFPIDRLKIDRSFVDGLLSSASDGAIVRSIIGLGRSLGLFVVAEGVETADQIDALRELGCDAIQGYVFSRPLPPEQLPGKLCEALPGPAAA
jgi:diguanylate cyclase (GGDEF)-like protein/PAS domain S-box-containing protein